MGIKCNIAITSVQAEGEIALRQIVQKRLEYIRYGQYVPKEDIGLEYVAYPPITVDNTLFLADLSGETPENSQSATYSFNDVAIYTTQGFLLPTQKALITNRYISFESGLKTPLFYAHALPADTVNVSVQKATNYGGELVDPSTYEFDEDVGCIFGSFKNTFDETSGRFTMYYVEGMDTSNNSIVTLWNGEHAFHEATFDDIDPDTGWLYPATNAYIANQSINGWYFSMPKADTYFVKPVDDSRIQVLEPTLQTAADPWFVEITPGVFTANINGTNYNYAVPEYETQNFSPVKPLMFTSWERALKISKEAVKFQRENIFISLADVLHMDLIVLNKDNEIIFALTTDSSKQGQKYANTDIEYNATAIDSWDNVGGILSLNDFNIRDSYTLRASYYYQENNYTFTTYNLNPLFHEEILEYMFVVYIVPDVPTGDNAIYYLLVKDNIIHYCSQTGNPIPNLSEYNSDGTPNPDSVIGWDYEGSGSGGNPSFHGLYGVYPQYLVLAEITGLVPERPSGREKRIASSS